jgi:hypothetical protein
MLPALALKGAPPADWQGRFLGRRCKVAYLNSMGLRPRCLAASGKAMRGDLKQALASLFFLGEMKWQKANSNAPSRT